MTTPHQTTADLFGVQERAEQATPKFGMAITPGSWTTPTNCDMDVRARLNHLLTGHHWAAELVDGNTIADVDSRLDGDVLAADPLAEYDKEFAQVQVAFSRPAALSRSAHSRTPMYPAAAGSWTPSFTGGTSRARHWPGRHA